MPKLPSPPPVPLTGMPWGEGFEPIKVDSSYQPHQQQSNNTSRVNSIHLPSTAITIKKPLDLTKTPSSMNSLKRSIRLRTPFAPLHLPPRVPPLLSPPRTRVHHSAPRRAHTTSSSPPDLDKVSPPSKETLKNQFTEAISFFSCAYVGDLGGAVIGEFIVGMIGEHIVDSTLW